MGVSGSLTSSIDRLALAVAAGWLVLAQEQLAAAEVSSAVSLVFEGDSAGCVDERTIEPALASRATKTAPDATVRLRAKVTRTEGAVTVEVSGDDARGPLERREFHARTCEDAVDALALYASLSSESSVAVVGAPLAAVGPPAPAAEPVDTASPRQAGPLAPSFAPSFAPSIGIGLTFTSLAEGQVGARLGFGLVTAPRVRVAFPLVEASFELPIPRTLSGGGGDAEIFSLRGRGTVVPIALPLGSASLLGPYAALEGGALFVSGSGPSLVQSRSRPYGAVAVGGMARVALGGRLSLVFSAGTVVPFLRDEFVFVNGGTAYRVPSVGLEASFGVGMSFP